MCESVRSRRLAQPVASDGARKSNLVGTVIAPGRTSASPQAHPRG